MADDKFISIAAAAKTIGLNKSTLSRQVKTGAIRSHGGKVRLSEVLEDRASNIDLAQSRRRPSGATDATAGATPADATTDDPAPILVDGALVSFAEAQRIKENYLAKLRGLEFDLKSKRLVDAEAVHRAVFELARAERDALVNWPARVAPLIAAELGVEQVTLAVALEKHVRQYLAERSEPVLRLES